MLCPLSYEGGLLRVSVRHATDRRTTALEPARHRPFVVPPLTEGDKAVAVWYPPVVWKRCGARSPRNA